MKAHHIGWFLLLGGVGTAAYVHYRKKKAEPSASPAAAAKSLSAKPAGATVDTASSDGEIQLVSGKSYHVVLWANKDQASPPLGNTDWKPTQGPSLLSDAAAATTSKPKSLTNNPAAVSSFQAWEMIATWGGKTDKWNLANPDVSGPTHVAAITPVASDAKPAVSGLGDPLNYCAPFTSAKC